MTVRITAAEAEPILEAAERAGLAAVALGETGGDAVVFRSIAGESRAAIADLKEASDSFFRDWMED